MLKHSPLIGQTLIHRYEVQDFLGEARAGQIFLVWDRQSREHKAAKIVDGRKGQIPLETISRFKSEGQILQSLRHPHIIRYEDFFETHGLYVLITEYANSFTLTEYLEEYPDVPLHTVLFLFQKLVEALVFVHNQGLVHHDLKCSNILFSGGNRAVVKILDFGFSEMVGSSERMGGTLAYIAPEQTGILNKTVDHRADLYSLGIVIYQTLTGQLPFKSQDPAFLIHQHAAQLPKKPSKLRPDTPPILEKIILKLLHKDPNDRYRTTNGLLNDLLRYRRFFEEHRTLDANFELGTEDHWDSFLHTNPFVGREEALDQLHSLFQNTRKTHHTQTVFLEGIQGIGKTTLFKEFQNVVHPQVEAFFTLSVQQEAYDLPFRWVKALFEETVAYLKNLPEDAQKELVHTIKQRFAYRFELYVELVPELSPWVDPQTLSEFSGKRNWGDEDYEALVLDFFQRMVETTGLVVFSLMTFSTWMLNQPSASSDA